MNCINCGIETINPNYCSRRCSAINTNKLSPKRKRVEKKCTHCNNPALFRSYFCQEHKDKRIVERSQERLGERTLEYYFSKDSLKNLHASSKATHIRLLARSWFKDLTLLPCAKCGYNKHVELCHIKAIKSFSQTSLLKEVNCRENIIQLCPNCHWELDKGILLI